MNKKFLVSYLMFFLLFCGCSEKPIAEKQKAINAYKEKQNRQYVRDSKKSLICVVKNTTPEMFNRTLKISPDGRKVVYASRNKSKTTFYINVNNQQHPPYPVIMPTVIFSPDSRNVAYIAGVRKEKERDLFIVKNGKIISETYSEKDMSVPGVIFSPDSKNIAYSVRENELWKVKVDDSEIEYPAYDGTVKDSFKFTPDSQHLIYGTGIEVENKYFLLIGGIPQKAYPGIGNVVVANKHIAYLVGNKKGDNLPNLRWS